MENEEIKTTASEGYSNSRKWTGIILLAFGILMLLHHIFLGLPMWIFSWQMLLIVMGLSIGVRSLQKKFRERLHGWGGWLLMIAIGTYFLLADYFPGLSIHSFLWPFIAIWGGLILIFKPRSKKKDYFFANTEFWQQKKQEWKNQYKEYRPSGEDYLDVITVLSSTKKNILSKDFKGGEIVSFLGGAEINLSRADINGRVVIDATQVLGGTKLIVPAHWDVRAELVSVFGGVEDKRPVDAGTIDYTKILVLRGTSVFGGIEICSF